MRLRLLQRIVVAIALLGCFAQKPAKFTPDSSHTTQRPLRHGRSF
jgi:hypothetical protein